MIIVFFRSYFFKEIYLFYIRATISPSPFSLSLSPHPLFSVSFWGRAHDTHVSHEYQQNKTYHMEVLNLSTIR